MFYTDCMPEPQQRFSVISDKSLVDLRKLIGVPIEDSLEPWCYEASRDNIRHWAHGIGDDNPLWCDPKYAATTAFERVQAPPSFIFPLNRSFSGYVGGLAGVHAMFAGIDVTWHRADDARRLVHHQGVAEGSRRARHAFRRPLDSADLSMRILQSESASWSPRAIAGAFAPSATPRASAAPSTKRSRRSRRLSYSREDLAKIFALYEAEEIRGATPRYIEDVHVGDKLQTMVKGPMTVTGFIAFAQGWGGLYIRANKLAWKQLQKHPGLGIPNKFGIPDVPERVHWEDDLATLVGTPAAYDYGPERCSWMSHHLTNWMGDSGFLRKLEVKIRRHNPVGDTLYINGEVTRTFAEGGRALCRDCAARGQSGRGTFGARNRHHSFANSRQKVAFVRSNVGISRASRKGADI